jgi:hypothetical protein
VWLPVSRRAVVVRERPAVAPSTSHRKPAIVDEKTGIRAKERLALTTPDGLGGPGPRQIGADGHRALLILGPPAASALPPCRRRPRHTRKHSTVTGSRIEVGPAHTARTGGPGRRRNQQPDCEVGVVVLGVRKQHRACNSATITSTLRRGRRWR